MAKKKQAAPTTIGETAARAVLETLKRYGAQRFDNSVTRENAIAAIAAIPVTGDDQVDE